MTGSFKIRGAANRLLRIPATDRAHGVVTASAGNHAQGVATAAVAGHIPAVIVVPQSASTAKIAALRRFDPTWVELRLLGADYDEAEAHGIALAHELGRPFISAYNDPQVIAGQGTVAYEMLEAIPDLDVLLVPVGGGGLAAGIGVWAHHVRPSIRVIGVQATTSPAMYTALAAGHLTTVPVYDSLADGLAGNIEPGSMTFPICQRELESVVLVEESDLAHALRTLVDEHHVIAEGSGVAGVAALLSGAFVPPSGSRVGVVLSGRNIATTLLSTVLAGA